MPRESAIPIDLPSLDDLFTTQAERDEVGCEKVGVIPLYMICLLYTSPSPRD